MMTKSKMNIPFHVLSLPLFILIASCDVVSDRENAEIAISTRAAFEKGECQPLNMELFDQISSHKAHQNRISVQFLEVNGTVVQTKVVTKSHGSEIELVLAPWSNSKVRLTCEFPSSSKAFVQKQNIGDNVAILGRTYSLHDNRLTLVGCIEYP